MGEPGRLASASDAVGGSLFLWSADSYERAVPRRADSCRRAVLARNDLESCVAEPARLERVALPTIPRTSTASGFPRTVSIWPTRHSPTRILELGARLSAANSFGRVAATSLRRDWPLGARPWQQAVDLGDASPARAAASSSAAFSASFRAASAADSQALGPGRWRYLDAPARCSTCAVSDPTDSAYAAEPNAERDDAERAGVPSSPSHGPERAKVSRSADADATNCRLSSLLCIRSTVPCSSSFGLQHSAASVRLRHNASFGHSRLRTPSIGSISVLEPYYFDLSRTEPCLESGASFVAI